MNGGYQKGEETKERILNAALEEFGEASFLAVTTRGIAEAACVSLPTLQYYFGSSRACTSLAPRPLSNGTAATRRLLRRQLKR
jgi:AcrR family transcriptional regulator